MDARRPLRGAALGLVVAVSVACGTDPGAETIALPGLVGGPAVSVPTPPPVPTTVGSDAGGAESSTDDVSPTSNGDDESPSSPETGTDGSTDIGATTDAGDQAVTTTMPPASTTVAPTPTATTVEVEFLRLGDEGPVVASVQRRLIALEYLAPGGETGVFDRATADALIDFQAQYGLVVDGIFGPETDRALNAAAASVG